VRCKSESPFKETEYIRYMSESPYKRDGLFAVSLSLLIKHTN
jgi:hypothetical protein